MYDPIFIAEDEAETCAGRGVLWASFDTNIEELQRTRTG